MSPPESPAAGRGQDRFPPRFVLLGLLLLALGCAAPWLLKARAYTFPDAPSGKLACVSYTPRTGVGGDIDSIHRQIDADLAQLAQRSHCVRTYAVSNGLDYVPTVARKHGLRVLLGLWIGVNETTNAQEIAHGIEVARANKDVIDAVIVGNEVLLRREQNAEVLKNMLKQVHDATELPVTYADVWEFWLRNPQLAEAASFVTIHILPYWEDDPVSVGKALRHIGDIYEKVARTFPDKRILVGETGWPSAGRQREAATPSLVNQARFFREFIAYANARDLPYNFIEAYDQQWKKHLEGAVGGYWGIYDVNSREKFPLTGVVREDPTWWRGPIAAFALSLVAMAIAWQWLGARSRATLAAWALGGFAAGAIALLQWDYMTQANRNLREWTAMVLWSFAGFAVFAGLLKQLTVPATSAQASSVAAQRLFRFFYLFLLIGIAYVDLGLSFDPRYRGFPTVFVVLPAAVLALHAAWILLRRAPRKPLSVEETLLVYWMLIAAPWIALYEGPHNWPALNWSVWSALLALALVVLQHVKAREQQSPGQ